jgi:hypothetical protein
VERSVGVSSDDVRGSREGNRMERKVESRAGVGVISCK